MSEEEVILKLIKQSCQQNGCAHEEKVLKMAQILNIHPERYEKIKTKLLETGKINTDGENLFLL
ncbi:MAG: hypothetical protein QXY45_02205 [Candidatus Aenigmatarchaeota archaeon]